MNWWRGGSKNELGVSLPDEAAQLETETEPLQARNQRDADRKCEEIAEEYGGTDPRAVSDIALGNSNVNSMTKC